MSFGGPDDIKTTTETKLSPEQKALIEPVIPIAQEYLKNPPTLPDYSQIAPFNPVQLASQQAAIGAAGAQQGLAGNAASAQNFLLDPALLSPESNPALQGYIDATVAPITEQLMEEILPGVTGQSVTSGQYGSTRQGVVEGNAIGESLDAIAATTADIANQGYATGLDALTKGLALAPQTAATQTLPASTLSAVGDVRQALAQAQLSEQAYRDLYSQISPFLAAEEVAALGAGLPGGTTVSTGTAPTTSPIAGAVGGASLAAGLGATNPLLLGLGGLAGALFS